MFNVRITNSTDRTESGWVLVDVQGLNTVIVINFPLITTGGQDMSSSARMIEELSPPI